jgi:predicted PurR-regulated permease PerM
MTDAVRISRIPRPWFTFTGCALAIAILYWAQIVLVPLAFAVLLAFVLAPVVSALQGRIGRVAAVLTVVTLTCTALGLVGWLVTQQLASIAGEIPGYQQNIHQKIRDIRGFSEGGSLDQLQSVIDRIGAEIGIPRADPSAAPAPAADPARYLGFAIRPALESIAVTGLVIALLIALLLEREELRARMIRLFGHGRLVATTRAFDDAGGRVSRYLLAQSLVNVVFGACVGIGTFLIGLPFPLLWAVLAGLSRYVPYIGPILAGSAPLLVALALEGWTKPLLVFGLFGALELVTNLWFESAVYAGVAGISQVALLVSVAFWAWLWGPFGILLATPLTVCLAVMGKHVPGLGFVSTLISDEPVLDPDIAYYQRLLAGDKAEAIEIVERYADEQPPESIYDEIMVRALNYAERDRIEERLTADEEGEVIEATRELLVDSPVRVQASEPSKEGEGEAPCEPIRVLAVPANGDSDVVALLMLDDLLAGSPITFELQHANILASEVIETARRGAYRAVCIADLPPSAPAKSRYITKRLRAIAPDLPIVVGRWAPPELADESDDALLAVGATRVAKTLIESRDQLVSLLPRERAAVEEEPGEAEADDERDRDRVRPQRRLGRNVGL